MYMNSLILVAVILMVFLILKGILEKKFGSRSISIDFSSYAKRSRFMNDSELAFFVNLKQALGERYLVFCKVRIEDFVEVRHRNLSYGERNGKRNRIKSNHVDFLVCDHMTTAPLLAIEVNGKSHERSDRMNRDVFVEKLYESVGLPFYLVKVGSDFHAEADSIRNMLDGKTGIVEAVIPSKSDIE